MKANWKSGVGAWLALAVMVGATVVLYPRLPDPMPTHWNAAGEADDFSSRAVGAWLLPLVAIGMYGLLGLLPRLDPRRANYAQFGETFALVRTMTAAYFAYLHIVILLHVVNGRTDMNPAWIMGGVGVLLMLIGNYLPRVRSNWFMGIRTPWTLSSEHVWRETHRLGGRCFVLAGLLMVLGAFFLSETLLPLLIVSIVLASLVPVAYSFWLFQQEQRAGQEGV